MTEPPSGPMAVERFGKIRSHDALIGIIGLGYVGLPLALAFVEKSLPVLGFDVDPEKVAKLTRGEGTPARGFEGPHPLPPFRLARNLAAGQPSAPHHLLSASQRQTANIASISSCRREGKSTIFKPDSGGPPS